MSVVATVLIVLVALLHAYFLVLQMFLWTKPAGQKAFGLEPEVAEATKTLAANQGLYNGFLVAGLVWGLLADDELGDPVRTFFLPASSSPVSSARQLSAGASSWCRPFPPPWHWWPSWQAERAPVWW